MVEVFVLPVTDQIRVRHEAARIHRFRRQITRSNAIRALDAQIVKESTASGSPRGTAFAIADAFMAAVVARIAEIEKLSGEHVGRANIVNLPRKEAAA